jgi:hypothetical protein
MGRDSEQAAAADGGRPTMALVEPVCQEGGRSLALY